MADLDQLGIQIEAEDKKASSALDSLEKSLSEIANLLKGMKVDSSMSKGLSDIAKGTKDIASAIRGLNSSNIESVGKAAKTASSDAKNAAHGMKEFADATKSVSKDVKGALEKPFGNLDPSRLLPDLSKIVVRMPNISHDGFIEVEESIIQMASRAGENFRQAFEQSYGKIDVSRMLPDFSRMDMFGGMFKNMDMSQFVAFEKGVSGATNAVEDMYRQWALTKDSIVEGSISAQDSISRIGTSADFDKAIEDVRRLADSMKSVKGDYNLDGLGINELENEITAASDAIKELESDIAEAVSSGKLDSGSVKDYAEQLRFLEDIAEEAKTRIADLSIAGRDVKPLNVESIRAEQEQAMKDAEYYGKMTVDKISSLFRNNKDGADAVSKEMDALIDKMREYKSIVSDMESGKTAFNDKEYRDAVNGLNNATAAFKRYKDGITQGQPDIDAKSKQIAQSIMGIAKNFNPAGILAPFRRVVEGISNMLSQLQRFWNRAMRTFTFMLVRKAITAILKDTHAAMQSLANFNNYVGTAFNQSMSSIVSNFRWLGANIVAAFAPLVNAVAPIIDFVITKIVQLVTAVNMLFAKLTGADHYVTAQKKMINFAQSVSTSANTIDNSIGSGVSNATKPIADSYKPITNTNKALGDTGKALKKLKSYTLGFDELNIIEPDDYDWLGDLADDIGDLGDVSSSMPDLSDIGDLGSYNPPSITFPSGSISGDAYEWVEHELPGWFKDADMFEIGKWISDNLTETLANIDWDSIYEKARNFGSGLAAFLNGLITPELFYQVGRTIAKALGTVVQWALKLGEEFDFKNLGESLAAAVNGFFQNFPFADLANTIDAWVQGIWTTIKTFVANIKWGDVLNGLKEFFGNLDPETYALLISLWFGKSLLKGITSGISLVKVAIAKVITDKLTDVIKMSLGKAMAGKAIEGAAGKAAGGAAGGLFGNIGASISGALSTIAPFVASIGGAVVAVGSFFDMWNNGWSVLKEVLKDIGIAIAAVGLVIAGVVTGPIAAIGAAVVAVASTIAIVIHDNWDAISNFFANTIPTWWSGTAVPFLQSIPQKVAEVFGSIPEKISGAMSAIKRKVSDVVNAIGQWFSELPYKIGSALGFVVGHLFKWGMDIGNWAKDNIPKIVDGIVQWFKSLPEKIGEFLTGVVAKFKEWGQGLLTWITTEIPKVIDSIASFFISLPQKLFDAIRGFIDKLIEWKNACISWITTNVPAIAESIISFFISLPSRFIQIGKDILQGLWNGITWAWQTVKEGIANFARGFVDTFKSVLGIHSPSTVAAEIGTFFVQGLVQPFTGSSYIAPVNTFLGKFTGIFTEKIGSTWKSLDKNTDSTFKGVQTTVKGSLQSVQEDTTSKMTGIQSSLTTVWRSVNQSVTDQFQQMQRKVESANNAVVSSFRQAWNQIPAIISGAMQSARNSIDAIVGGVDTLKSAFSTMGSSVQSFDRSMSEVANTLSRVETPIKKVADIIADLKKAFDTTLRFKVMVPVFAMRGKFDAESGQVPEVFIQYWNTYAHGGFPEDGFFFANSSELVGRFTNGRTAVANNAQIIEGIKRGVYEAVLESQGGNGREVDLLEQILDATRQGKTISIDGRELVGTIENRQRRNGYAFQAV